MKLNAECFSDNQVVYFWSQSHIFCAWAENKKKKKNFYQPYFGSLSSSSFTLRQSAGCLLDVYFNFTKPTETYHMPDFQITKHLRLLTIEQIQYAKV